MRFTILLVLGLISAGLSVGPLPFAAAQQNDDMDEEFEEDWEEEDMYMDQQSYGSRRTLGGTDVYSAPVLAVFKNMDLKPLFASDSKFEVRKGPALEVEGKEVFSAGNHALACQLVYGHMAVEYDEAQRRLAQVKLSKLLKRPVWNLRWAVSMAVRGGDEVADPSPIVIGASSGFGAEDMDMDFRPQRRPDRDEFMDEEMDMDMVLGRDRRGRRSRRGEELQEQESVPPMLNTDADEQMEKYLGGVATACADEFDKRFVAGDFGTSFQTAADSQPPEQERGQPEPRRRAANGQSTMADANLISKSAIGLVREASPGLPMWRPGLVFLGVGSSSEIIETAKAEQIDLLIHFDVVLKEMGRQTQTYVQNVSRARLINVAEGKSMIVSKAMDSVEVHQLQASGRLSDTRRYIDEQMSAFWRTVDREAKLTEMPELSPESARRRIGKLLGSGGRRNLRTLAEVRLYQSQGLIETSEVDNAYDIIGGSDALMMMHGPRDERLEMARTWAIEAVSRVTDE